MLALTDMGKRYAWCLGIGIAIGLAGGWGLWRPSRPIVETAAPAVRQKDSSLVLARRPDTVIKIVHQIPKGYVPERSIEVAVSPATQIIHDSIPVPGEPGRILVKVDTIHLAPVRIALTLVRDPAGAHRVIASSPDGRVLDSLSVDVPLGPSAAPARTMPWSAGALYGPTGTGWGAYVGRTLGPLQLLAGGAQGPLGGRAVAFVGLGLRF